MRLIIVSAAAVAVLLAGCSGADEQAVTLPPLPSASVSPSPSPSPSAAPSLPPAATADDAEGAAAFTRYFFEAVNRAYETLDAKEVQALSDPQCNSCKNIVNDVNRLVKANHIVEGQRFAVRLVVPRPETDTDKVFADVRYSADPYVEIDSSGKTVDSLPAQREVDLQVAVTRSEERWRMRGIRDTPQ